MESTSSSSSAAATTTAAGCNPLSLTLPPPLSPSSSPASSSPSSPLSSPPCSPPPLNFFVHNGYRYDGDVFVLRGPHERTAATRPERILEHKPKLVDTRQTFHRVYSEATYNARPNSLRKRWSTGTEDDDLGANRAISAVRLLEEVGVGIGVRGRDTERRGSTRPGHVILGELVKGGVVREIKGSVKTTTGAHREGGVVNVGKENSKHGLKPRRGKSFVGWGRKSKPSGGWRGRLMLR